MDLGEPSRRLPTSCDLCTKASQTQLFRLPVHTTSTSLSSSAKSCSFCRIIYDGISIFLNPSIQSEETDIIIKPGDFGRPLNVLVTALRATFRVAVQFFGNPEDDVVSAVFGTTSDIAIDTSSDTIGDVIKDMISLCIAQHTSCVPKDTVLPKRVLYIGPLVSGDQTRLHVSIGQKAKYIALSHCWGKHQSFVMRKNNIRDLEREIPWEKLPRTYKDAIRITRLLGIHYLWIDSLCIMQDNKEDWAEQSTQMSEIYANAYLTIAASLSVGDDVGFLEPRKAHTTHLLQAQIGERSATIHVREQISHDDTVTSTQAMNPLFTRAWCFQELLISPRVLSFNRYEIQWHCLEKSRCECDGWNGSSLVLDGSLLQTRRKTVQAAKKSYKAWYMLVEAYTSLQLTVPTDRLPALSGLATCYQKGLADEYFAGLWKSDLGCGLDWQLSYDAPGIGKLPTKPLGPTWSWVSVDSTIIYTCCVPTNHRENIWTETPPKLEKDQEAKWQSLDISWISEGTYYREGVHDRLLTLSGCLVQANLTVPDVNSGADERLVQYSIEQASVTRPDSGFAVFRPDVPLQPYRVRRANGFICSAARSFLKPGETRKGFTATVWVLKLGGCRLVLGVSPHYSRNWNSVQVYERLGVLNIRGIAKALKDKYWEPPAGRNSAEYTILIA